jgi:hypothetical protein
MTLNRIQMSGYEGCLVPETLTAMAKLAILVFGLASTVAAQATATVAGTVNDAQGGIIPGAAVTLISETRGTTFRGLTSATGDFVLTNVPGDTYTVSVTMTGFKKAERTGVLVVPGDRVAVPTIVLEVGGAGRDGGGCRAGAAASGADGRALRNRYQGSGGQHSDILVGHLFRATCVAGARRERNRLEQPDPPGHGHPRFWVSRALPPGPTTCWTASPRSTRAATNLGST